MHLSILRHAEPKISKPTALNAAVLHRTEILKRTIQVLLDERLTNLSQRHDKTSGGYFCLFPIVILTHKWVNFQHSRRAIEKLWLQQIAKQLPSTRDSHVQASARPTNRRILEKRS